MSEIRSILKADAGIALLAALDAAVAAKDGSEAARYVSTMASAAHGNTYHANTLSAAVTAAISELIIGDTFIATGDDVSYLVLYLIDAGSVATELFRYRSPADNEIAQAAIDAAATATTKAGEASIDAASAEADRIQTGLDRTQVAIDRAQAEFAALASGGKLVTTLTTPSPSNGTVELLQTVAGVQVWQVVSGTWVVQGWLGEVLFNDVAALLTSTLTGFQVGHIIRTRKEGFSYLVAPTGVTDYHAVTAGGVLLYVNEGADGYNIKAFGAKGDGVTDDTAAIQAALDTGGEFYIPSGAYNVTGNLVFTSSGGAPKTLILRGESTDSIIAFSGGGGFSASKSNYSSDFILRDVKFTSDGDAATKVSVDCARAEVYGCTFVGFDLALEVNQAYQLIQHNTFYNCATGIKCIDNATVPGAYYNANAIVSNLFASCSIGIDLSHNVAAAGVGSSTLTAIILAQNVFETCSTACIRLRHAANVTIEAPYFEPDCPVGLDVGNFTKNVNVLNAYSPASETILDNSNLIILAGKLQDITLTNSSTLTFAVATEGTLGVLSVDGTSKILEVPTQNQTTNWTALSPASGWSATGAPYQTPRVFKDGLRTVFVEGFLTGGVSGSVMTVLPVGSRPSARISFVTANVITGTTALVRVDPDGNVLHIAGSTTNIGINFSFKL